MRFYANQYEIIFFSSNSKTCVTVSEQSVYKCEQAFTDMLTVTMSRRYLGKFIIFNDISCACYFTEKQTV